MISRPKMDSFLQFLRKHWILLMILLVGTTLRCYNLTNIPYTHDEISALLRIHFDSFSELLDKGIKIDGHPAGVQTFIYYWTRFFGTEEWVLKLPFILTGILSIVLIYKIGKNWFNETVGLAAAAFIATAEYTVMYSQIARPYTSGMFVALLMVYGWSKLVFDNQWKSKYIFCYVFGAVACAYNHHFSLLFAGLVGLTGLFFVPRKKMVRYLLFSTLIVLLYLPHLSIFLYQLGVGGVENWLSKPKNDFIIDYIKYVFSYSKWVYGLMVILFILPFVWRKFRGQPLPWKKWLIALWFFSVPFLIGFFYSRYATAVLQFSVLIFGFPFLLLFFFGLLSEQSKLVKAVIVFAILFLNTSALIFQREYYKVFYVPTFKQVLTDGLPLNRKTTFKIVSSTKEKVWFYDKKMHVANQFKFLDDKISPKEFQELIAEKSKYYDQLYLGALSSFPPSYISIIRMYYPTIKWEKDYFITTTYLFTKTPSHPEVQFALQKHLPKDQQPLWIGVMENQCEGNAFIMKENEEWGPSFNCMLNKFNKSPNDCIDVELIATGQTPEHHYELVVTLNSGDSLINYSAMSSQSLLMDPTTNRMKLVVSVRLNDIPTDYKTALKTFVWNNDKLPLKIESFTISPRKGNHYLYALFDKIR